MGWRVMKRIKGNAGPCAANWETSTGSCTVEGAAAEYDSGEYWCEMGGQQRSNTVNVTVTGGSVVLESPVHPVMQGDNVTLSCRTKETSSSFMAEFYKDGVSIGKSSTGTITSPNLSRFDEGFYKCSISDVGESPQSWLSVISEGASPPHRKPHQLFLLLSLGGSVFLVLLLLLGFLLCRTHQPATRGQTEGAASTRVSSVQSYSSPPTDEEHQPESSSAEAMHTTYATVTRPRGVKESISIEPKYTTYATVTRPREVKAFQIRTTQ
uniref:Ig-like domain-containing protein n=1 Tax=Amphiprion ocellaris TaxID=80972 RepID=A0AAQ5ZVI6_AMPOC